LAGISKTCNTRLEAIYLGTDIEAVDWLIRSWDATSDVDFQLSPPTLKSATEIAQLPTTVRVEGMPDWFERQQEEKARFHGDDQGRAFRQRKSSSLC
jgi:hypothetical protein